VLLVPAILIPVALAVGAVPEGDGRLPDLSPSDLPPTVYCCDLDGNCVVAVDGEPCKAEETEDLPAAAPVVRPPAFERTMSDRDLPAFDKVAILGRGDLMRWMWLNPAVHSIVTGTVVQVEPTKGVVAGISPHAIHLTRCTLAVDESFKGRPQDVVSYEVIGGMDPITKEGTWSSDAPACALDERVLVFLMDHEGRVMPTRGSLGHISLVDAAGSELATGNEAYRFFVEGVIR
jgi:hypothetical protein